MGARVWSRARVRQASFVRWGRSGWEERGLRSLMLDEVIWRVQIASVGGGLIRGKPGSTF
jgi:hypothetical protein